MLKALRFRSGRSRRHSAMKSFNPRVNGRSWRQSACRPISAQLVRRTDDCRAPLIAPPGSPRLNSDRFSTTVTSAVCARRSFIGPRPKGRKWLRLDPFFPPRFEGKGNAVTDRRSATIRPAAASPPSLSKFKPCLRAVISQFSTLARLASSDPNYGASSLPQSHKAEPASGWDRPARLPPMPPATSAQTSNPARKGVHPVRAHAA
jgi:hypothetical protein